MGAITVKFSINPSAITTQSLASTQSKGQQPQELLSPVLGFGTPQGSPHRWLELRKGKENKSSPRNLENSQHLHFAEVITSFPLSLMSHLSVHCYINLSISIYEFTIHSCSSKS